jgi:hypothetical protein
MVFYAIVFDDFCQGSNAQSASLMRRESHRIMQEHCVTLDAAHLLDCGERRLYPSSRLTQLRKPERGRILLKKSGRFLVSAEERRMSFATQAPFGLSA